MTMMARAYPPLMIVQRTSGVIERHVHLPINREPYHCPTGFTG